VHKTGEPSFRKLVHYFLFKTTETELRVPQVAELKDAKWFTADEATNHLTYSQNKEMFAKAMEYIPEYESRQK
jgi:NADH pyrophosphatase NudC (nudix superfamily)